MTEAEKWRDPWYMGLSPLHKLIWIYLVDVCDNAGVWVVNERLANLEIGADVDWKEAANAMFGRIRVIDDGRKWYLVKFIRFQQPGGLNPKNNAHSQILRLLALHDLKEEAESFRRAPPRGALSSPVLSSSSSGGDARGGARSRSDVMRDLAAEFGLAANPSAVTEWVAYTRDVVGAKTADETRAFIAWVVGVARRQGLEMKYHRHAGDAAARDWRENHQAQYHAKGPTT